MSVMQQYAVRLMCGACGSAQVVSVPVIDRGERWQVVENEPQLAAWVGAHHLPKMEPIGEVPSA